MPQQRTHLVGVIPTATSANIDPNDGIGASPGTPVIAGGTPINICFDRASNGNNGHRGHAGRPQADSFLGRAGSGSVADSSGKEFVRPRRRPEVRRGGSQACATRRGPGVGPRTPIPPMSDVTSGKTGFFLPARAGLIGPAGRPLQWHQALLAVGRRTASPRLAEATSMGLPLLLLKTRRCTGFRDRAVR